MRAVVTEKWGEMAVRDDVARPEPAEGQCRLRVRLAGVCGSDVHIYDGHHPTAVQPVIQGHEFVATIDAIGPGVETRLAVGDRVVAEPLVSCRQCEACRRGLWHVCRKLGLLGIHRDGAFAEYMLADAAKLVKVPESLSDEVAALAEPFAVGVHVCRRGELRNGERALIIGAGPIGLIVAIVAEVSGARVTLSELNPQRIAQAKAMGFDVIDAGGDAVAAAQEATEGDGFDVVFEVSGSQPGVALALEAARVQGRVVQVGFFGKVPEVNLLRLIFKELSLVGSRVYTYEDFSRTLPMLDRIVRAGRFDLGSLITETIALGGIEAGIGRMKRGEVTGKLLVDVSRDG